MTFSVHGQAVSRGVAIGRAVLVTSSRIDVAHYFVAPEQMRAELERLREFEAMGLLRLSAGSIEVSDTGWYLVRAIAMQFDKHLQQDRDRARFSKII